MNQPVEVGLILELITQGLAVRSYEPMSAFAHEADRLGFHSVWLCDHFFTLPPGGPRQERIRQAMQRPLEPESSPIDPLLEVWTTLSALARDTERLRLGASVLAVGYRNPALLAKMTATLDVISEGRVEMGMGAGWVEVEYRAYGFEFPKASVRITQMEKAIQIMKCMWTEPEPVLSKNSTEFYTASR